MKCKVCGANSKSYQLCRDCYQKKEEGKIIKCVKCQQWHHIDDVCKVEAVEDEININFLYERKQSLLTDTEKRFLKCIQEVLPEGYILHMQSNLATFIQRTDNARYKNELFRNVDFLITDTAYTPMCVIEINDETHHQKSRRERDLRVQKICEEAGIPIINLWTKYGVKPSYIEKKIKETLTMIPIKRIPHSQLDKEKIVSNKEQKKGCYVATCVYGSYDCPQVWILRRFRDQILDATWYGRTFIKLYYVISPTFVKYFGKRRFVYNINKKCLDIFVAYLDSKGFLNTPYKDK